MNTNTNTNTNLPSLSAAMEHALSSAMGAEVKNIAAKCEIIAALFSTMTGKDGIFDPSILIGSIPGDGDDMPTPIDAGMLTAWATGETPKMRKPILDALIDCPTVKAAMAEQAAATEIIKANKGDASSSGIRALQLATVKADTAKKKVDAARRSVERMALPAVFLALGTVDRLPKAAHSPKGATHDIVTSVKAVKDRIEVETVTKDGSTGREVYQIAALDKMSKAALRKDASRKPSGAAGATASGNSEPAATDSKPTARHAISPNEIGKRLTDVAAFFHDRKADELARLDDGARDAAWAAFEELRRVLGDDNIIAAIAAERAA